MTSLLGEVTGSHFTLQTTPIRNAGCGQRWKILSTFNQRGPWNTLTPGVTKLLFNLSYKYKNYYYQSCFSLSAPVSSCRGTGDYKLPLGVYVCFIFVLSVQYVSLLFLLDEFLCQWDVRLKNSNNALAMSLLRDSAEWSLTMPPPTGRQMALARKKPSFVIWNQKWCIASLV